MVRLDTYSIGDHGRENGSLAVLSIELAHQQRDHGELNREDDGMEERLLKFANYMSASKFIHWCTRLVFVPRHNSTFLPQVRGLEAHTYLPKIYRLFNCRSSLFLVSLTTIVPRSQVPAFGSKSCGDVPPVGEALGHACQLGGDERCGTAAIYGSVTGKTRRLLCFCVLSGQDDAIEA